MAVDATPSPGLRAPYNFMGYLNGTDVQWIRQTADKAQNGAIVAFGHYPTSFVGVSGSGGRAFDEVMGAAGVHAYLCGHLHTMFK